MVRVVARPTLNATTRSRPWAVLLSATAAKSNTIAEGQGTSPPETPSARRLRQLTVSSSAPGGRWECALPPCEWVSAAAALFALP